MRRVPTGIEKLDEILQGGFPRGSTILVAGGPGTGKTIFAAQFIYFGAVKYEEKGVFVTFEESADFFKDNMLTLGWNFDDLQKKRLVTILDFISIKGAENIEIVIEEIIKAVKALDAERLVIDSITALTTSLGGTAEIRIMMSILQKALRGLGCTTLLTTEIPWGESTLGTGVEEFLSDGIILLEMNPRGNLLRRRLIVLKMRGTELNLRYYQYNISKNIGIEMLPYPEAGR
ncbi:MAG: ATPase domain-containing protein [Candidatus Bathyarchaeia archaeon]